MNWDVVRATSLVEIRGVIWSWVILLRCPESRQDAEGTSGEDKAPGSGLGGGGLDGPDPEVESGQGTTTATAVLGLLVSPGLPLLLPLD